MRPEDLHNLLGKAFKKALEVLDTMNLQTDLQGTVAIPLSEFKEAFSKDVKLLKDPDVFNQMVSKFRQADIDCRHEPMPPSAYIKECLTYMEQAKYQADAIESAQLIIHALSSVLNDPQWIPPTRKPH